MKIIMNVVIGFLIAVAFAACQKATNPVSPDLNKTDLISSGMETQGYNGNYEVTYKNYRNTGVTTTVTGSIDFIFGKTTYTYNGQPSDFTEGVSSQTLHDAGTYLIHGNTITMADNAIKMMAHAGWMPSLYLSGEYSYKHSGDQVIIEGTGSFGSIKIVLKSTQ